MGEGKSVVLVYDSIPAGERVWNLRLKDLPYQLQILYGDVDSVQVICSQNQGRFTHNCGVYAIANSIMILNRQDPRWYQLKPPFRAQLIDMLNSGAPQMQLFLAEKRPHPLDFGTSDINNRRRLERKDPEK